MAGRGTARWKTVSERSDSLAKTTFESDEKCTKWWAAAASFLSPSSHHHAHHLHPHHHNEHHLRHQQQQAAEWIKLKPGQVCWQWYAQNTYVYLIYMCVCVCECTMYVRMGKCMYMPVSPPTQISGIWSVKLLSTSLIMALLALLRRCCSFSWFTWGVTWFVGHAANEFGYLACTKNAHIL